jgi:hypothetical protein
MMYMGPKLVFTGPGMLLLETNIEENLYEFLQHFVEVILDPL